jgi:HSP20 family protein
MTNTIRVHPDATAFTLREAMERLFDERDRRPVGVYANGDSRSVGATPRADVWEDEDQVTLEIAVPGVDASSVGITYEQGLLTVVGEVPPREESRSWILAERARGGFERRFHLKVPIDADRAAARVDNGVLVLTLPKREEVKARRIEVVAE